MSATICLRLPAARRPTSSHQERLRFTAGALVDALACGFLIFIPILPPVAAVEFVMLHLMSATLIRQPWVVPTSRGWLAFIVMLALPIAGVGVAWVLRGRGNRRAGDVRPR